MKNTLYVIKLKKNADNKKGAAAILNKAEESYERERENEYTLYGLNYENFKDKYDGERDGTEGIVAMVCYEEENGRFCNQELYAGYCEVDSKEESMTITYKVLLHLDDSNMIHNLLDKLDLDLKADYESSSYVMINHFTELIRSFEDLLINSGKAKGEKEEEEFVQDGTGTKEEMPFELHELACHQNECVRRYRIKADRDRAAFQRDRERIVNSKAFRRLVDKAQIFGAQKGDHYRTRMTHTLEVNQIAKAIAYVLGLNLDLTEAIALGHDLGHTPFGHQGERTLQAILSGTLPCIEFPDDGIACRTGCFGGFKHNYQGLRVLNKLEEKYVAHEGLNISCQVMEGVLKHTKLKEEISISDFADKETVAHLKLEERFTSRKKGYYICSTLEGQAVALADEIAQRGHDVDDAISSGLITVEELIAHLDLDKYHAIREELREEKAMFDTYERTYISDRELMAGRMVSAIVHYFINGAICYSRERMDEYERPADGSIDKEIVTLSKADWDVCRYLEQIINRRVISSAEVARFDHTGNKIIYALFQDYYRNPRLLHKGTLQRIYSHMLQHEDASVRESAIHLGTGNIGIVKEEIQSIVEGEIGLEDEIDLPEDEFVRFEKRKILVRNITDFIAGMTDSYALQEYKRLHP
ncbi:dGTP triphosphohydrolase [Extibacter muris]|uniref:deoxyguanosinetriphosphate triphosphohydrolase family protein n=1 Tax=Extibacter muris TaxID=1796622 RepID=UPI002ED35EDF